MPRVRPGILLLLAACASPLAAQPASDVDGARRAALDYLEGFYEGDSLKLARSVSPRVQKSGWFRGTSGSYSLSPMTFSAFFQFAAGVRAGRNRPPAGAPKEVRVLEVLDQIANIRVTAWWGVDYLLMGKEDGKWMISHVLWQSPPAGT
jgi:hypothetical protein